MFGDMENTRAVCSKFEDDEHEARVAWKHKTKLKHTSFDAEKIIKNDPIFTTTEKANAVNKLRAGIDPNLVYEVFYSRAE